MKRPLVLLIGILAAFTIARGQNANPFFDRLQGLATGDYKFFNIDGIDIAAIPMKGNFDPKSIARNYRDLQLKDEWIKDPDTLLSRRNFYVSKKWPHPRNEYTDHYFLWYQDRLLAISFASPFAIDRQFERDFTELFIANKIPASVYQPPSKDGRAQPYYTGVGYYFGVTGLIIAISLDDIIYDKLDTTVVDFAGRRFEMKGCHWLSANNVQCRARSQMSWSSFDNAEAAQRELEHNFYTPIWKDKAKAISDEQVDVIFEGEKVKARKVIYDFKEATREASVNSRGKTLTVYMLVAPVRGRYLKCMMTHWNKNSMEPGDLTELESQVMSLK